MTYGFFESATGFEWCPFGIGYSIACHHGAHTKRYQETGYEQGCSVGGRAKSGSLLLPHAASRWQGRFAAGWGMEGSLKCTRTVSLIRDNLKRARTLVSDRATAWLHEAWRDFWDRKTSGDRPWFFPYQGLWIGRVKKKDRARKRLNQARSGPAWQWGLSCAA